MSHHKPRQSLIFESPEAADKWSPAAADQESSTATDTEEEGSVDVPCPGPSTGSFSLSVLLKRMSDREKAFDQRA